jgi:hypothetical protein
VVRISLRWRHVLSSQVIYDERWDEPEGPMLYTTRVATSGVGRKLVIRRATSAETRMVVGNKGRKLEPTLNRPPSTVCWKTRPKYRFCVIYTLNIDTTWMPARFDTVRDKFC